MLVLLFLCFFILGTIIGSFLNVAILRYGTKKLSGRSCCFSCGKPLRWFELVPILSFFIQKGRCRGCRSGISWQYPLVELITGLIFALVAWKNLQPTTYNLQLDQPFLLLVVGSELLVWCFLVALSAYDVKHKIIPDALVYSAAAVSLLILLRSYFETYNLQLATYNFFSGFLLATPVAALWFFSKGRAIGLGDAKLILLFPWFLGLAKGISALIIGFWIGAAVSLGALCLKTTTNYLPRQCCLGLRHRLKHLGMKTEFPLGPFLVLGLLLVYLFSWDVTGLSLLLPSS